MSGEMIESGWAQSGPMAIWTRENGPFARRAALDDHWGSENWRKLRHLRTWIFAPWSLPPMLILLSGIFLVKNLRKSLSWSKTHRAVAKNASKCLSASMLADWNKMREDFERDGTKSNPYEEPETCKLLRIRFRLSLYSFRITVVTIKSLRHQLDKDDVRKIREGHIPPHTVTPSVFIGNAIQIEEQQ